MRTSPVLAAAGAGCLLFVAAGPATAEKTPPPGGRAESSATLLRIQGGGEELAASTLHLIATSLQAGDTRLSYVPLAVNGEEKGTARLPSNGDQAVPGVDSTAYAPSLAGLLRAKSPNMSVGTGETPGAAWARAHSDGLGSISILGTESKLRGELRLEASAGEDALAEKHLLVQDLELLSAQDLLAALGIDTTKLPRETIVRLVQELGLVETTIETALRDLQAAEEAIRGEIDAAQQLVADAEEQVLTETKAVQDAEAALKAAEADAAAAGVSVVAAREALAEAEAAEAEAAAAAAAAEKAAQDAEAAAASLLAEVQAAADLLLLDVETYLTTFDGTTLVEAYQAAVAQASTAKKALDAANAELAEAKAVTADKAEDLLAAESVHAAAEAAVAAAREALAAAQRLLDAAQQALADTLTNLAQVLEGTLSLEQTLRDAVRTVLDDTPLLRLERLQVKTLARSKGAGEGEQETRLVGGEAAGLHVLGTDVLGEALGTNTMNLAEMAQTEQDLVQGVLDNVLGTLSDVLSNVPGHPGLSVPAPRVELMNATEEKGVEGGYGYAKSTLQVLTITLPGVSVPRGLLLPGAETLPALKGAAETADGLTSTATTLSIGELSESATYLAAAAAPVTQVPAKPPVTQVAPPAAAPPAQVPPVAVPPAQVPQQPRAHTPPQENRPVQTYTLARTGGNESTGIAGILLLLGGIALRRLGK